MGTDRGKQVMLGVLLLALVVIGYRTIATMTSPSTSSPSNGTKAAAPPTKGTTAATGAAAPDVHLDALNSERPKPVDAERNLFRFKAKAAPPPAAPPAGGRSGAPPPAVAPPGQGGPAPLPPIPLKFIGAVNREGKPTIAVLSDGQGPPMYGVEGGTIAGRYRILRIGVESIEMSYLDGRGRQTIRLTGS
jgi:hypothetical protein